MKSFKQYKKEKQTRLNTFFTDFSRDQDAEGFILSKMDIQFQCVPDNNKTEDVVMTVIFHGTLNVNGASACEKLSDDSEALPFPPNDPKEMALYCATAMLDHIAKVYTIVVADCERQLEEIDKHPKDSQQSRTNLIKSEHSSQIVLKESEK